jgi:hypothetical protein
MSAVPGLEPRAEAAVAEAAAIIVGRPERCGRVVLQWSPDPSPLPLEWLTTAALHDFRILKGEAPSVPVRFARVERVEALPPPRSMAEWEADFGTLSAGDDVVVLLSQCRPPVVSRAVPSGDDERDLATLVAHLVALQQCTDAQQRVAGWVTYLESGAIEEGRRAALRTLVGDEVPWPRLGPVVDRLLRSPGESADLREYTFAALVHGLIAGRWSEALTDVVQLLCARFLTESDPELVVADLESLIDLMDDAVDNEAEPNSRVIQARIERAVHQRPDLNGDRVDTETRSYFAELRDQCLALSEPEVD